MKNPQDIPTIEEAIAVLAEATKIVHKAYDREYRRRRANLVNTGMSRATNGLQIGMQEDVRGIVSMSLYNDEQKRIIQASFHVWTPPHVVREVHLPVIK